MRSVTVVAFCGLRVTQSGDFAVVCFKVRACDRFVTASALAHDLQFEARLVGSADRVRGMTIAAHGESFGRVSDRCGVDTGLELSFDPVVTLTARGGNICTIHAREGVGPRPHVMRRMAT